MEAQAARNIPLPLKREVRQRCGFGCVICGIPLIEYHHMTPWEAVHEHTVDNLTLLCPNHHKEATEPNASISEARIREYNADPFNLKSGWSSARPLSYREPVRIEIGPNFEYLPVDHTFAAIAIDGFPLLGFNRDQDHLLLNFDLRDERNRTIVRIIDNEVTFAARLWDVDWVANLLTVRRDLGDIVLRIRFAADSVRIERATLRLNGAELVVTDVGIQMDGHATVGWTGGTTSSRIGANFGTPPIGIRPGLQYSTLPRSHGYCQRTFDARGDVRRFLGDIGMPKVVGVEESFQRMAWALPVDLNTVSLTVVDGQVVVR